MAVGEWAQRRSGAERNGTVVLVLAAFEGRRPASWLLTETFRSVYGHEIAEAPHWVPSLDYYLELAQRIDQGQRCALRPPCWAEPDWRFAEFPNPASQALHGAVVELMALPLLPADVALSLIRIVSDMYATW